jgi:hypothetical protein
MRYLFNGAELIEAKTFEFYGIQNGDAIIALPAEVHDSISLTSQWLSLTRDNDAFNESMRWMVDPRTSDEAARLRDLHLLRAEAKSRGFLRVPAAYLKELITLGANGRTETNWEAPSEPSRDTLPALWDLQSGNN